MNEKQEKAFLFLETSLKELKVNKQYRNWILYVVKNHIDDIKIITHKFKLDRVFYSNLLVYLNQNHKQLMQRREEVKLDSKLYKVFNLLKRKYIIHKDSSYFPKSLMLLSINPNPFNILNADFEILDKFVYEKKIFEKKLLENPTLEDLYIYFRIYHSYVFTIKMLENLQIDDVLSINQEKCVLVLYYKLFLKNSKSNNKFYKTVVTDNIVAKIFFVLKSSLLNNEDRRVFQNYEYYEKSLDSYKKSTYENISMLSIKTVNKNFYTFEKNTINNTFRTNTITTVPLSIKEIDSLYPTICTEEQMIKESMYINTIFKKIDDNSNETIKDEFIHYFDLYESYYLEILIKSKKNTESVKNIINTSKDIKKIMKYSSKSEQVIYAYILYELEKLLVNKLALSTFKNYLYTLNKHLFSMIEDINKIQDYEIREIIQRLENNSYSKNTVDSINRAFTRFFAFASIKGFTIDIPALLYPKSIVFKEEIDLILEELQTTDIVYNSSRKTKKIKLILLQKQVMILIAFYSGLRKNELRTRQLKDLYFIDNKIYVDVNSRGMKNLGLHLKTKNSLRRVEMTIVDINHLSLLKEWWNLRQEIDVKSKYLFIKTQENKIYSKVIQEDIFNEFNKTIKKVTKRYATFHSLRHSFATYRLKAMLDIKTDKPYDFMELSIDMGHQTPDTTANNYIHYELLKLLSAKKGLL